MTLEIGISLDMHSNFCFKTIGHAKTENFYECLQTVFIIYIN
jgi:hypothetical protein